MCFGKSFKLYRGLGVAIIIITIIIIKSFLVANQIYTGTLIYLVL